MIAILMSFRSAIALICCTNAMLADEELKPQRTLVCSTTVISICFSPDGMRVAVGLNDGKIEIWDTDQKKVRAVLKGHEGIVWSVAFSPDGTRLASAGEDATVRLWDAKQLTESAKLKGHDSCVRSIVFSPDGKRLASGGEDKDVRVWNVAKATEILKLEGHTDFVTSVAFDPSGDFLVSGSQDSSVKVWNLQKGMVQFEPKTKKMRHYVSVRYSPDSKTIVASDLLGIAFWDAKSGEPTGYYSDPNEPMSICFTRDGLILASCSGLHSSVTLWDVKKGERAPYLLTHEGGVSCIAFNPKGDLLVSGGLKGTVMFWKLKPR